MEELNANAGQTSLALRRRFAAQAFATSAAYDSAIAGWINGQLGTDAPVVRDIIHIRAHTPAPASHIHHTPSFRSIHRDASTSYS